MTDRLTAFARAVARQVPESSPEDVADALWLALQIERASGVDLQLSKDHGLPLVSEPVAGSVLPPPTDALPQRPPAEQPEPPPVAPLPSREPPAAGSLQLPSKRAGSGTGGHPFRTPTAAALSGRRELLQALRPLMRRVPMHHPSELDLQATLRYLTEEKIFYPRLRPALERWFRLVLIIEDSPSMGLWQELTRELHQMLASSGAFGSVHGYGLATGAGFVWTQIRRARRSRALERPGALPGLSDPQGRTLILWVSDCVSPAWSDGRMATLLRRLESTGPQALVQMLPEHLFDRTALAEAVPLWLRQHQPGASNCSQQAELLEPLLDGTLDGRTYVKLPVVTLSPGSLRGWARTVSAAAGAWARGYGLLLPDPSDAAQDDLPAAAAPVEPIEPTAQDRVRRFRLSATPTARRLAQLLATFSVLSLPLLRLVRGALLKEARQPHEAEVLLGGLLETFPGSQAAELDPEQVQYGFFPGVREALRALPPASGQGELPSEPSVLRAVSQYVAEHYGTDRSFMAVVSSLGALAQSGGSFADLSEELLRELAQGRQPAPDQAGQSLVEWASPSHPLHRRARLAAVLGDPVAASLLGLEPLPEDSSLNVWLFGLGLFGTSVLSQAAVAVARHVHEQVPFERQDLQARAGRLLMSAEQLLLAPSVPAARQLSIAADSWSSHEFAAPRELTAMRCIAGAAMAVSHYVQAVQPYLGRVTASVREVVTQAQQILLCDDSAIKGVVRKDLMARLFDARTPWLVARPRRGALLSTFVDAGPDDREIAAELGRVLAAAGYMLAFTGTEGIQGVILRGWAAELERRGELPPSVQDRDTWIGRAYLALSHPDGLKERPDLVEGALEDCDVVLLFGSAAYDMARAPRQLIVPLPWTGTTEHFYHQLLESKSLPADQRRLLRLLAPGWEPKSDASVLNQRLIAVLDAYTVHRELFRDFAVQMVRFLNGVVREPPPQVYGPRFEKPPHLHELEEIAGIPVWPNLEGREARTLSAVEPPILFAPLLPAMRDWLLLDAAHLLQLNLDAALRARIAYKLCPLIAEHAWPQGRLVVLSALSLLYTEPELAQATCQGLRRRHGDAARYRAEIFETTLFWLTDIFGYSDLDEFLAKAGPLRLWLHASGILLTADEIGPLVDVHGAVHRGLTYLLLPLLDPTAQVAVLPGCLAAEHAKLESEADLRALVLLLQNVQSLWASLESLRAASVQRLRDLRSALSRRPRTPLVNHLLRQLDILLPKQARDKQPLPRIAPTELCRVLVVRNARAGIKKFLAEDEEVRAIHSPLSEFSARSRIQLRTVQIERVKALSDTLLEYHPHIIHVVANAGFERSSLQEQFWHLEEKDALPALLQHVYGEAPTPLLCVFSSEPWSSRFCEAILESAFCVIRADRSLPTTEASDFCAAFYRALASGMSLGEAFQIGSVGRLASFQGRFEIEARPGIDPARVYAVDRTALSDRPAGTSGDLAPGSVRQELAQQLRTDQDLNAFCLDYFPQVHGRFTGHMNRTDKINILLAVVPAQEIRKRLAETQGRSLDVHRGDAAPALSESPFSFRKEASSAGAPLLERLEQALPMADDVEWFLLDYFPAIHKSLKDELPAERVLDRAGILRMLLSLVDEEEMAVFLVEFQEQSRRIFFGDPGGLWTEEPLPGAPADRPALRERLVAVLRTDSDFDAFCIDCFPSIFRLFTNSMSRIQKFNMLLERESTLEIWASLRRYVEGSSSVGAPSRAPERPLDALMTKGQLRQALQDQFRTSAEFDAFCIDHFWQVSRRFSAHMERKAKESLLLELVSTDELQRLLQKQR